MRAGSRTTGPAQWTYRILAAACLAGWAAAVGSGDAGRAAAVGSGDAGRAAAVGSGEAGAAALADELARVLAAETGGAPVDCSASRYVSAWLLFADRTNPAFAEGRATRCLAIPHAPADALTRTVTDAFARADYDPVLQDPFVSWTLDAREYVVFGATFVASLDAQAVPGRIVSFADRWSATLLIVVEPAADAPVGRAATGSRTAAVADASTSDDAAPTPRGARRAPAPEG